MKFILFFVGLIGVMIFLSGCVEQSGEEIKITNFEECIAAGNPVMESYPRQCMTPEGETFTEEINMEPSGEEEAINMAKQAASGLDSTILSNDATTMTVKNVVQARCPGCWMVELEYSLHEEDSNRVQKAIVKVTLDNWEVTNTSYSQITDLVFSPEECEAEGGRSVNIVGGDSCNENEINIGDVVGFISPNICCVPQ